MKFGRTGREQEPGFQMSPMIDIVFQILIFFMVVSVMKATEQIEVEIPVATDSYKREGGVTQEVTINITTGGTIVVNQKGMYPEELFEYLKQIHKSEKIISVYIRGDKDAYYEKILDVMEVCAKVGIYNLNFATYREKGQ